MMLLFEETLCVVIGRVFRIDNTTNYNKSTFPRLLIMVRLCCDRVMFSKSRDVTLMAMTGGGFGISSDGRLCLAGQTALFRT